MRLCSLASILPVRPFDHKSANALLRNVLITAQCKRFAYVCQPVAYKGGGNRFNASFRDGPQCRTRNPYSAAPGYGFRVRSLSLAPRNDQDMVTPRAA